MPYPFAHELRGERLKADTHHRSTSALENAETRIEKFADGKICRATETHTGATRISDSRQGKGSQLLAIEIEAKEIPLIVDATEVVRPNPSRLRRGAAQFPIGELDLCRI